MKPVEPILVIDLFPKLLTALLDLLSGLEPEEWHNETVCEGWSVKDITAHLLADDLGLLSRQRDGYAYLPPAYQEMDFEDWDQLVGFINANNQTWVEATRRLSPQVLVSLLAGTGKEIIDHFRSLDPFTIGEPVHWAGNDPAPKWLDLGREYTERWLHQQHIREAVGKAGLVEPEIFSPVLDTFMRALPHTYRQVEAEIGTTVSVEISGEAGNSWTLQKTESAWALFLGASESTDAKVAIDQDTAWRLFTKGVPPQQAQEKAQVDGDEDLAKHFFETVSILA